MVRTWTHTPKHTPSAAAEAERLGGGLSEDKDTVSGWHKSGVLTQADTTSGKLLNFSGPLSSSVKWAQHIPPSKAV